MSDLVEPLFSCSAPGCREECSYPAGMLAMWNGEPICEGCYEETDTDWPEPMWADLPRFVPAHEAELTRLRDQVAALEAREARLRGVISPVFARLDTRHSGAPDHCHQIPGIWDMDNTPDLAGKPCEWCAQWEALRAALQETTDGQG